MQILTLVGLSLLPLVTIMAGVRDLTTMTIPNWMSAVLVLAYVPVALLAGLEPMTMLAGAGVAAAMLAAGVALFALRVIGGGDAKLMAAASLWLGLGALAPFVLWTAIAGGLFSLVLMIARSRLGALQPRLPGWLARLLEPQGAIPYGVAIAVGVLAAYPHSALVEAALMRG